MGFRFRRSVRIAPGLRLNLSKSGLSFSVGGRGATVNISKKGTRTTLSLPGTGISYQTGYSHARRQTQATLSSPSANLPAYSQPGLPNGRIAKALGIGVVVLVVAGVLTWVNLRSDNATNTPASLAATPDAATVQSADAAATTAPETLKVAIPATRVDPQTTVTVLRAANLRSGPSVNDAIIGITEPGDTLVVVRRSKGWIEVQMESGAAWIAGFLAR